MIIGALWGNLGDQLPYKVYTGVYSFLLYTLIIVSQASFYENLASPLVNEFSLRTGSLLKARQGVMFFY